MTDVVTTEPAASSTGSSTMAVLVRQVRFYLEDRPLVGYLNNGTDIASSDQSFTVDDGAKWEAGTWGEFDDDTGEQFYCLAAPVSNSLPLVRRGYFGTTASDHDDGTFLLKEPRFPRAFISSAITQAVAGFRGLLWVPTLVGRTPSTTDSLYQMPADFQGWIAISQQSTDTVPRDVHYGVWNSNLPVNILRDVDSSLIGTTLALQIPVLNNSTNTLEITYGADCTTDNLVDGAMTDAAIMGAVERLIGMKDVPRTGQDVSQNDSTSTPGVTLRTATWARQQKFDAIRRAQAELLREGPLHI